MIKKNAKRDEIRKNNREKRKELKHLLLIEKYGKNYETLSREEKIKITKIHNNSLPSNENIIKKFKKTCIEKYGVENPMQEEKVKEKAQKNFRKKYNTDFAFNIKKEVSRKKALNTLKENGGIGFANPETRKIFQNKLKEKYGENVTESYYINYDDFTLDIILKKENLRNFYLENKKDISEMLKKLNCSEYVLLKRLNDYKIENLFNKSKSHSSYEKIIKNYLENFQIKTKSTKKIIYPQEIDLYNEENKIGIEFNGTYWHCTAINSDKKYHQKKFIECEKKGIFLYSIFEYDWINERKQEIIKSQLLNLFHKTPIRIYARNCEIKKISSKLATDFINENHLQGDGNLCRQINYGLFYKEELVYVACFGK
jgi:hypothetical protein